MTKKEFIKQVEKYEEDERNGIYHNPHTLEDWRDANYQLKWDKNKDDELWDRIGTVICEFFEY
jgi:ABC-type oligopeptide transport system substrate-binding subunit